VPKGTTQTNYLKRRNVSPAKTVSCIRLYALLKFGKKL